MRRGRDSERLVRKPVGEHTEERADSEILVDDDHGTARRSLEFRFRPAAEERVGSADLCERVGKLVGQVPHHDPSQDLAAFGRDARIAAPPLPPELLEQLLSRGHLAIVPLDSVRCTRRWAVRGTRRLQSAVSGPDAPSSGSRVASDGPSQWCVMTMPSLVHVFTSECHRPRPSQLVAIIGYLEIKFLGCRGRSGTTV